MAKKLFNANDNLFLICDGTYARHQKSTNIEYQRKSFSGQKKVPLCKPFTLCTTDGYIVDMLGPYFANQNDALKILFTGSYQLSQAVSYLTEIVDKDDKLKLEYVKDQSNVLKLKIPSRHISRTTYRCFVRYIPNSVGVPGLTHYTCECANGKRTVGSCSHIAAVVYYLSYARYLSKIFKPVEILSEVFKKNNYIPVIESDSDKD
ncbi:hypothetical protein X777_04750 [Ooceraea biroi]|uniref:SWIM-type domain-containing protein n=1 Tax=Ooceraea biroi TaxID=2015173 RepID=A0A026WK37_OOCBI|nr:hypothetical protein X777_04750 [Ooceraea biroi]